MKKEKIKIEKSENILQIVAELKGKYKKEFIKLTKQKQETILKKTLNLYETFASCHRSIDELIKQFFGKYRVQEERLNRIENGLLNEVLYLQKLVCKDQIKLNTNGIKIYGINPIDGLENPVIIRDSKMSLLSDK